MLIMDKHFSNHLLEPQAKILGRVAAAALRAADPREAVRRALRREGRPGGGIVSVGEVMLDVSAFRRVRLAAVGKAALSMARGLLDVLGDQVSSGLVITKHLPGGEAVLPASMRVLTGGHPVPSVESALSAQALAAFLQEGSSLAAPGDDLLFVLISGGGSALMTLPVEGVSLADLQELTRLLLACGATIGEMNTLRKHLDQVKGGGLARLAAPARVITLILSDVIGSPLDVIASGPTVGDSTTYDQALQILRKYRIENQVPVPIRRVLESGARGSLPETLKPGSPILESVTNVVVASNAQAAEAAIEEAHAQGLHALLLTTSLQGEASEAGLETARLLRRVALEGQPLARPACIVAGGETTVALRGSGTGGRNQELALAAVAPLAGLPDVALVTLATDGEDGPTDAAGAVVTGDTMRRAAALGLDPRRYLENNDSYNFFAALDDLLITGPTGTNVNDLLFLFAF